VKTATADGDGLAGIVAGKTEISGVGKKGHRLTYRGYAIEELAEQGSFEEVAWLLLRGELPSADELRDYRLKLVSLRHLPNAIKTILEQLPPTTHPMDVLRTGCSALGAIEPESESRGAMEIADRLLAALPSMLLYWHHFCDSGKRIDVQTDDDSIAGQVLHLLRGRVPDADQLRALDVSLILYAELEFNASTFAARVAASTLADFYGAITCGIATLRGSLHGGANEAAFNFLSRFTSLDQAEAAIMEMFGRKERVMGFGHRVYRSGDPRSPINQSWAERLSRVSGQTGLYEISRRIDEVVQREKGLFPNVDFYCATTYHMLGIPSSFCTPLFVLARTAGWSAHVLEQRANNRLIRPNADYIGPAKRAYVPLKSRTT
jgi:2-methylcitrate synthase